MNPTPEQFDFFAFYVIGAKRCVCNFQHGWGGALKRNE